MAGETILRGSPSSSENRAVSAPTAFRAAREARFVVVSFRPLSHTILRGFISLRRYNFRPFEAFEAI